jgi:DinB superfamily
MPDPMLASAAYVLKDSLGELRRAVDGLPDEALNWEPAGDDTNSVAVLVTHVLHSTRSWVSTAVAAPLPDRDRASEFRVTVNKTADLLALLDDFGPQIMSLLNDSEDIDWAANRKTHMRPDPSLPDYVPASFALLHAIEHFGQHVAHVSLTHQLWDARNAK